MTHQLAALIFLLTYIPAFMYVWVMSKGDTITTRVCLLMSMPFVIQLAGVLVAAVIAILLPVGLIALGVGQ